jgi:translation initiation factor IF-2
MPIKQYSRGSYQQPTQPQPRAPVRASQQFGQLGQAANPQLGDPAQNRGLSGLPRMPTRPPGQRPGSTPPQLGNVPRGGQPGQGLQPRVDPGFNLPRPPAPGAGGPAGGKGGGGAPPPGLGGGLQTLGPESLRGIQPRQLPAQQTPPGMNPILGQRAIPQDRPGPGGRPGQPRPPGQPVGK